MSGHQRSVLTVETLESRLLLARSSFRGLPKAVEQPAIQVAAVASDVQSDRQQVNMLLVGDSITSGIRIDVAEPRNIPATTSYRPYLWDQIATARPDLDVRFVGPTTNNSRNSASPTVWEGIPEEGLSHAGYAGLASASFLPNSYTATDPHGTPGQGANGWATYQTDIAVMLVGINDLISGHSLTGSSRSVDSSVRGMISAVRLHNPSVDIVLGTMPEVSERFSFASDVVDLNEILTSIVEPEGDWVGSTDESPIVIVDHANGVEGLPVYDVELHSGDGIHPNTAGDVLLAANWWSTLSEVLPAEMIEDQVDSEAAAEEQVEAPLTPSISIQLSQNAVNEGESTRIVISRDGNLDANQMIHLQSSGNAERGLDFVPLPRRLHFAAGVSEIYVDFTTVDDGVDEFDEFLTIRIRAIDGYLTGFGSSILIRDGHGNG